MTTEDRINKLSEMRSELYRSAGNGRRGRSDVLQRIDEISREIETLWEKRRRERAGRREGIDGIVDRVYERTYGRNFDDVAAPPAVGDDEVKKRRTPGVVLAA